MGASSSAESVRCFPALVTLWLSLVLQESSLLGTALAFCLLLSAYSFISKILRFRCIEFVNL